MDVQLLKFYVYKFKTIFRFYDSDLYLFKMINYEFISLNCSR